MKESAELKTLTMQFYRAMEDDDMAFISNLMSRERGTLAIGTDPDEWWEGFDLITKVMAAQLKELKGISLTVNESSAYSEGAAGWVAEKVDGKLPNGAVIPFRSTSVWHVEDGAWKITQWHLSIGVSNEESVGSELTTS